MPAQNCETSDLAHGWSVVLLWGVPVIALVVGSYFPRVRLALWIPAFLVMGVACLVNARRCGRVHCFVTGPLSLLAIGYVVLAQFHMLPMNAGYLLDSVLAISILGYLIEIPLGRYRKRV